MKRILIFTLLWSLGLGAFAQEHYYWEQGEKYPLTLDPTRKYLSVRSEEDMLALQNRLIEQNIQVSPYRIDRWNRSGEEAFCFYGVEVASDYLPDFSEDETIVYEGGYYRKVNSLGGGQLHETFCVELKNSDDFPKLKESAEEINVNIMGRSYELYYLFCTKAYKGNALQMANLCYESGLCDGAWGSLYGFDADSANPGLDPVPDSSPTGIDPAAAKPAISLYRESDSSIAIEAAGDLINEMEVFDLSGKILHRSSYSGASRVNWEANQKGLYLVKVRLQSGNKVYRKMII
jgi:hypothetical protein